jgi:hypothetical protein
VLQDSLQKLMENVGSDQPEDVEVGKECPEWVIRRFHACINAGSYELDGIDVCEGMCCQDLFNVTEMGVNRISAKLVVQDITSRTLSSFCACDQELFRIISGKAGNNGVIVMNYAGTR